MATIRIGISGWRYTPWRGTFYPDDLTQKNELRYAASKFPSIEINGSFYSLQYPYSYKRWYEETPDNFVFAVKGGRFITHMRKLREIEKPLANFFASGVLALREKLGPVLWQFPPTFRYERARFEQFFELLPHDTEATVRLARKRDSRMKGRVVLSTDTKRAVRHAVEIRHESFQDPSFIELLRAYGIGLVVAETAKRWPMMQDITADFVYLRLHGDKELYRSGYGDKALDNWARRIACWHQGKEPSDAARVASPMKKARARDIYCFFDNTDVKLRAPFDARRLMSKLRVAYQPGGATFQGVMPRRRSDGRASFPRPLGA